MLTDGVVDGVAVVVVEGVIIGGGGLYTGGSTVVYAVVVVGRVLDFETWAGEVGSSCTGEDSLVVDGIVDDIVTGGEGLTGSDFFFYFSEPKKLLYRFLLNIISIKNLK